MSLAPRPDLSPLRQLLLAFSVCLAGALPAAAAEPATQDMIQALKPAATRGYRNLAVRQKADPGASASAPVEAAPAEPAAEPGGPAPSMSLGIQFEANSARVRPESGPMLGNLVAAMQSPELKTCGFVIEGHTDASGNASTNQRLSQDRAEEVRLYLVALGVHPSRLKAVGKGSTEPAEGADPAAAANRRVRVVTVE